MPGGVIKPAQISSIRPRVTINNIPIPCISFHITRGIHGSVSTFDIEASTQSSGKAVDIESISNAAGPDKRVLVQTAISLDGGTTFYPLMTGDLDEMTWDFDTDLLKFSGRGFEGRLVDSRVVLKDSQYVNKTPAQIATQFAADAGLQPDVVTIPGEEPIGYLGEHNLAIRTGTPITKWSLLVLMARLTGRAVLVKSGNPGTLFFGPVDLKGPPRVFTYGAPATALNLRHIRNLKGEWRPFKNSTFQVIVLSYHPQTTKLHVETVVAAGESIQYEVPQKVKPGMYKGAAAGVARLQIGALLKDKPAYVFYVHGIDAQKAQTTAETIARDIAKREFLMHGTIAGIPDVNPLDIVSVKSANPVLLQVVNSNKSPQLVNLGPFEGRQMFINQVEWSYSVNSREGFVMELSMWHLRAAAAALADVGVQGIAVGPGVPIE